MIKDIRENAKEKLEVKRTRYHWNSARKTYGMYEFYIGDALIASFDNVKENTYAVYFCPETNGYEDCTLLYTEHLSDAIKIATKIVQKRLYKEATKKLEAIRNVEIEKF